LILGFAVSLGAASPVATEANPLLEAFAANNGTMGEKGFVERRRDVVCSRRGLKIVADMSAI